MESVSSTIHHHIAAALRPAPNPFPKIRARQQLAVDPHPNPDPQKMNRATRLAESLSSLLHLHTETHAQKIVQPSNWNLHFDEEDRHNTPAMSPKENISDKWREIHGCGDWHNLLDPLYPWLRREIVKYGEFAQATYDAFDFDSFSEFCGSCRYSRNRLFEKLGLTKHGYTVSNYIYAMSHVDVPQWLERSRLGETWSKDSNWMGFVAVSDEEESRRIGRRDIVVAWRGTVAPSEWYEDMQRKLEAIGHGEAKVEHGFLSLYTTKSDATRYNKSSASEQVMEEVKKLVEMYRGRGEEVSLTITGHSLGGALALLNAYEAAASIPGLPISVISFGAPRVGNIAFRDEIYQMGVKTLRVVLKQDVVPRMPGIVFNESLQMFDDFTGTLEWVYTHVGAELKLDAQSSPYLKRKIDLLGFHMLETYLHLVDGFLSSTSTFRSDARRDFALVNKSCDMLVDELRIPHCWYQIENKGLVRNAHGRWVKPKRDPEDIPSPTTMEEAHTFVKEVRESHEGRLEPLLSV
ncbi:phospholipase A1-Igamma1, chloroplastic [Rhododendron vialii]|uniref:phospholipase A1-Igamma1, chloroplastic n=1 Tax=Rhododendron vialii TaxID=182163 RepID=UPI00265F1A02|nr:phospholipase A1-Igamma1, chloroplastic [Rhododendron vialii]